MDEQAYGIIPIKKNTVLLVHHTKGEYWAFPKGHAEEGEAPIETAARELFEETGLRVSRFLDMPSIKESYEFERGRKNVEYFLAEVKGDISLQREETLDAKWFSLDEALKKITFPESKKVMATARDLLEKP